MIFSVLIPVSTQLSTRFDCFDFDVDVTAAAAAFFFPPGMAEKLEQQRREIEPPSEEAFVAEVRKLEKERARASERINQQLEEATAQEKDIERLEVRDLSV